MPAAARAKAAVDRIIEATPRRDGVAGSAGRNVSVGDRVTGGSVAANPADTKSGGIGV